MSVESVYIANAYKGHLILCPGGANGQIGGLLHQLDPPQHYSHMGIMVADFDLVRHCTALPSRLTAEEYYSGSVLGVAAPVDGLDPDHVQFGWPGAVTQSARQIHFADRYGDALVPPGLSGPYRGSNLVDPESSTSRSYRVAAVSFDGVYDDGHYFPALVVKPCPLLETAQVSSALGRIADRALQIYAHYRFYCYTDGAVGSDPNYGGTPWKVSASMPDWDPDTLTWRDWTDPDDVPWLSRSTIPGVCSSFVWQAIQDVNEQFPRIELDWAEDVDSALGESGGACRRAVRPDWSGDNQDQYTRDGFSLYDEESRKRAAEWLYDSLSDEVYQSLKSALASQGGVMSVIAGAIDTVGRGAFILAAEVGANALVTLMAPVLGPALDLALADQLVELLYDMPSDIANQVCNSFAFDCHRGFPADTHCLDAAGNEITDIDSSNFTDAPGVGRAVSPDNIHMFWDAPGPSDRKVQRGLYGYNEPVAMVVAVVRKPVCELVPSPGLATIVGTVRYRGQFVSGAYVKVNCQHSTSLADDGYLLTVRAGGYSKVVARYRDPATGVVLYGERVTGRPGEPVLAPGEVVVRNIELSEPPACLRNVVVSGTVRVDDVYLTGADHAETRFARTLFVQYGVASYDEDNGGWVIDPDDPAGLSRRTDVTQVGASVGDAGGNLRIDAEALPDLSVDVVLTGTIADLRHEVTRNVPDGATVTVAEFKLDTGGPFNDRAYFRGITITNSPAQAI